MLCALLAGCGARAGGTTDIGDTGDTAPPGYPVTVTNCGVTTTYERPPERVVAVGQYVTEIMLALGLEDRLVGTAYSGDGVSPQYRDAYQRIPVLAEEYPSYEVLLAAAPDFVYGGQGGAFGEQEGRSRERLREAGIETYLNVHECRPEAMTMAHVWHELRTIATIFGVEQRAQALIEDFEAELVRTQRMLAGAEPVSVFVYDSGTKAPMTAGGKGIVNEIIRLAGGRNIFSEVNDEFGDVSWEQVIQRRPERILIMDYGSTSLEQKKQFLLSNPALTDVPAVQQQRFAVLPLSSVFVGVRAPSTVAELGRQLHPGRFE